MIINNSVFEEHDIYMDFRMVLGQQGEAVSPVQSSLKPCYKGPRFNSVHTSWICA